MSPSEYCSKAARRLLFSAAGVVLGSAALLCSGAALPDEAGKDFVGSIDGEAITVEGPMNVEVVRGQVRTNLRSGSDIRVKFGQARIELVEGGVISICGPAHLSVLKSGGSLTVALDSGTIHFRIEHGPYVVVYTPQIQAKPIAIGDAPQDALVGLDSSGAMCIRATSGAVRIEQQLTGQSVIVPQGGDVQLMNAQFEAMHPGAGKCECQLQLVKTPQPKPPEASVLASAEELRREVPAAVRAKAAPLETQAPPEQPVYQVFMPPLAYDAAAKVQPEPDPHFILLVRRVRVRPTLIFQGRVEGEAPTSAPANQVAAVTPNPLAPGSRATSAHTRASNGANESVISRARNFLRRIWNPAS